MQANAGHCETVLFDIGSDFVSLAMLKCEQNATSQYVVYAFKFDLIKLIELLHAVIFFHISGYHPVLCPYNVETRLFYSIKWRYNRGHCVKGKSSGILIFRLRNM